MPDRKTCFSLGVARNRHFILKSVCIGQFPDLVGGPPRVKAFFQLSSCSPYHCKLILKQVYFKGHSLGALTHVGSFKLNCLCIRYTLDIDITFLPSLKRDARNAHTCRCSNICFGKPLILSFFLSVKLYPREGIKLEVFEGLKYMFPVS